MTESPTRPAQNEWSTYWTNDGADGEVFVSKEGKAHPEVGAWWQQQLSRLKPSLDIVDLACGAGSIFQHLPAQHGLRLFGADISEDALSLMRQRIPSVTTTACSADALPYADGQFDVAVSQFGIEYAERKAFAEAARTIRSDGRLIFLCHYQLGYIDSRNRDHLEHAQVINKSEFIACAKRLIESVFNRDDKAIALAAQAFQPAEQELAAACKTLQEGIHFHLYQGFRQLYEQRQAYTREDILDWLDAMQVDVEQNILRLEHMCRAASSMEDMQNIADLLQENNCTDVNYEPFQIARHEKPLAWSLTARKL